MREREKLYLFFSDTESNVISACRLRFRPIARLDYRWWSRCHRDRDRWAKENAWVGPFSCPFSAPAILYRPLAPRTGRGLMEIYDSHLIGFNVPRISSSRNASSDFFRTVCSFRALTTSAIKTYARGVRERWLRSRWGRRVSYGEEALSPSHAAKVESVLKAHNQAKNQGNVCLVIGFITLRRRMATQSLILRRVEIYIARY